MKSIERQKARMLRAQGYSLNEIQRRIRVSKGSISRWVRDIELTPEQQKALAEKGFLVAAVEKRRATRLKNESARRQIVIDTAEKEIIKLSDQELRLIGATLYWAEGGKTLRGVVRFSNSDPEMIKLMMVFFRKICHVPESKFRVHIHIHPHLNYRKVEEYWSAVTGIPLNQFYKTYRKVNVASKHVRDSLPYGTCDIYVCNTELFLKIVGWTRGICRNYQTISSKPIWQSLLTSTAPSRP